MFMARVLLCFADIDEYGSPALVVRGLLRPRDQPHPTREGARPVWSSVSASRRLVSRTVAAGAAYLSSTHSVEGKEPPMHIKTLVGLLGVATVALGACGSASRADTSYGATAAPTTVAAPAAAAPSSLSVAQTSLGKILVDGQGRTLYALTKDTDGTPTCTGACARAWPPATVTNTMLAGPGITAPTTLVDAPEGGKMLKAGAWPLYRFAGDAAPGDTNGQGSGGVWFVVGADGKLIKA
jgi:predicted lipoprotein with Yx(FWY)xxD motif